MTTPAGIGRTNSTLSIATSAGSFGFLCLQRSRTWSTSFHAIRLAVDLDGRGLGLALGNVVLVLGLHLGLEGVEDRAIRLVVLREHAHDVRAVGELGLAAPFL